MEYKYRKNAGALNEAAEWSQAPPAKPAVQRQEAQTRSVGRRSQNVEEQNSDDYVEAHRTPVHGVPVGDPMTAAQTIADATRTGRGNTDSLDRQTRAGVDGMFFYTVQDGERVRVIEEDGTVRIVMGPARLWRVGKTVEGMAHHVAHPGEFLIVRYRDGRQEHLAGPAHVWVDPREHLSVSKEDALQLSAREAIVVYTKDEATGAVRRRLVHGPGSFIPAPGEWLHTFSWHGSKGGHLGYQKVPNALVFQKLWLLPDQMYHDVHDVRTADDAVLTIRLMLFYELVDVERMLDTTHDPIGDFVNAATSDVVDFVGRFALEGFKRNTEKLNDLATYAQLTARAEQCGYRIGKVVYRGYGAPESLQRMHDEAIESRTRLQLERATQQQAQDLEDFQLERALARASRQRTEQDSQTTHELEQAKRRREAELQAQREQREFLREQERADATERRLTAAEVDALRRQHLAALRELGVDLTKLLTQARADRVIEVRGAGTTPHVHLDEAKELE